MNSMLTHQFTRHRFATLIAEADFEKEIEDIVEEFPELADLGDAIDKGEKAGEAALEAIKSDCRARTAAALEACKEHDAKRREIMRQVRNFLSGKPVVRLALNEDLAIGSSGNSPFGADYGMAGGVGVLLDDCNFHSR